MIWVALYRDAVRNAMSADQIASLDVGQGAGAAPIKTLASWRTPFRHLGMVASTILAALAESNTVAVDCISIVIFVANAASACSWSLVT